MARSFILIATISLSALIASFTTLKSSRDTVERYVSVWEEEIARNLLLKGDAQLFDKIRTQITDVASDIEATGRDAETRAATGSCFAEQTLNVTLYGTPAGELRVCRSPRLLLIRSLTSPVFAFGLSIGILFFAWSIRRANREAADRAISELALRVAHDIRAPLMALKVAANQASTGDSREAKSLIDAASTRITAIADDLLNRSRSKYAVATADTAANTTIALANSSAAAFAAPLRTQAKTIGTALQELVREKRFACPPGITIETSLRDPLPGVAPIVATQDFERVISNLLQNAVEATLAKIAKTTSGKMAESTVPRIVIDTAESEHEVAVTIRDSGVGIPKDMLSRIGEVGFTYGKSNGNGLGVSSARRWARDRGGDLTIRSLEGTGTEVRLTLPRSRNQAALL